MAEYKIGQRVDVTGKDVQGTIVFYGTTNFASGKWIGLKLDEPKGKNNGSVKGQVYFQCEDNYGMFVRPGQVVVLDEHGRPMEMRDPSTPEDTSRLRSRQSSVGMKPKPTTSRLSLASSRQSLAGSRQSLAGSRQSLVPETSKSQIASPVVEKEATEPISQIPKRSAFVETGFVETLKPQFTPGQALTSTTPITSIEEKLSNLQFQQELDNRNQQIRDLSEKLETLRQKRLEDKEKLKEHDKLKIQLEQLLEFKTRIMESQAALQRDLQRAKQDARDAIEAREAHAEEVADLAEAVEMATLDKEMAEEKAESLQLELEACREQLEEVRLDLEILKTEMQDRIGGGGGENKPATSTYEFKQLEQQNARLRETLVKLRDLSAHDKHEFQKLQKEFETKKSEIAELTRTKEKLSARVESLEQQIADLQEQVDAALGAEEMVVTLAEQKLSLEEKVSKLQEEISELEALQDMNEQLVEGNVELEADLREELDMAHAATREALRDRDAAFETIADREQTISKFRDLVHKLQEQSLELQRRLETESSKPVSALPEILDFKKMFTETKAHIKAIDLELRRIDVQQLQQHIKYLSSFMPEAFMSRGGDHDAILVLLLIPRLIHKTEILMSQIRDKFPPVEKIDLPTILKGHSVDQYEFRCRLSAYIYSLQTILRQYVYGLNTCKPEALLKVGAVYPEMAAQEKVVDGFVELVKRDQLDENVLTDALERCVGYFNTMYPLLLGEGGLGNQSQLVNGHVNVLRNACDGINNDALAIRCLIEGANVGDIGLLTQYIITTVDQIQQQLKLVKRRLPMDTTIANLGLNKEVGENLYQCYLNTIKVSKTLQDIVKTSIQAINQSGDGDKGLPADKIKDLAINASDKIYEQDDLGPVQSIKNSLGFVLTQISQLAQYLQDNEYEIATNKPEEKTIPPIQLRAEAIKKDLEQTKTLTSKLENKESDIKELRKALKDKQEQLSEMTIRKELAEKKLGNVNKDYELTIEKLQRKLEEAHNNFKKKEREFEETLDHLQTDIDSLESEKGEMKEKLKMFSKKAYAEGMAKSTSGSQLSSLQSSVGPSLPAVVRDSPMLIQEIEVLKKLLKKERDERLKLQTEKLRKQLESLSALPTFKQRDEKLDALIKEGISLKQDIMMTLATPKFPPVYKAKPGSGVSVWQKHFSEEKNRLIALQTRAEEFRSRAAKEIVARKVGGHVESDFTVFPTVEMTKALKESSAVNVGFVKVPKGLAPEGEGTGVVDLEVDFLKLERVLKTLTAF